MAILSEIDASMNGGVTNVSRSSLHERSHRHHYIFHRGTVRRMGFHTAMDEIPYVVFHSWIVQPFWTFPFCEESQNLKATVSMKRESIKEHLRRSSLNPPSMIRKT
jgi:hypothetical protein